MVFVVEFTLLHRSLSVVISVWHLSKVVAGLFSAPRFATGHAWCPARNSIHFGVPFSAIAPLSRLLIIAPVRLSPPFNSDSLFPKFWPSSYPFPASLPSPGRLCSRQQLYRQISKHQNIKLVCLIRYCQNLDQLAPWAIPSLANGSP